MNSKLCREYDNMEIDGDAEATSYDDAANRIDSLSKRNTPNLNTPNIEHTQRTGSRMILFVHISFDKLRDTGFSTLHYIQ